MSLKPCYICGATSRHNRKGTVRDDPSLDILECDGCGLVFLSSFAHISDQHYEASGMHGAMVPDIEKWLSETAEDDNRRFDFMADRMAGKTVLDFGCGNAGFIERAKSVAAEVAGIELERALQSSFEERCLKIYDSLESCQRDGRKWDYITAFHVIEHLPDPRKILKKLAGLLAANGELIIEVPNSNDALLTMYENEAFQNFTYWSQHLFLFNEKTLGGLLEQAGLGINWIRHIQRYPLSNHLYWLSKGEPGGHKQWSMLDSGELATSYEAQLALRGMTDTMLASAHAPTSVKG
jgi:2-polyprenyl-3-methyl-5-hydroxy-6-metoxy-1,4-benzoquinol methylase